MNILDRTIGWFSPRAGWERTVARQAMMQVQRAYDGASTGRRASGWTSSNAGPNSEIRMGLGRLRARTSEIIRNTPAGAKALRILANNTVGPKGLTAESKAKSKRVRKQIDEAWAIWIKRQCDIRKRRTFGGIQRLASRSMYERGDSIIRRIRLPMNSGRIVPLALQVLEGDYLDLTRYQNGNNPIVQGVELDPATGEPIAYWLWNRHPGELYQGGPALGLVSSRVPAEDIILLGEEDRPGQVRGVPRFAPVIATMRDAGDGDAADIVRRKIAACMVGFITSTAGPTASPLGIQNPASGMGTDGRGNAVESFEPGMIGHLKPGDEITFNNPPSAEGLKDFHFVYDHQIAAGVGVMYEQLTGDLSNVNYSSFRAGHLEFRTDMECLREDLIIPACDQVREWFIDAAVSVGLVAQADYTTDWTAPAWQSIDPTKDALADRMDVRSGFKPPQQVIAERGGQFDKVMADFAEANSVYDVNNFVFDTDPRRIALTQTGKGNPKPVDGVDTEDPGADDTSTDDKGA